MPNSIGGLASGLDTKSIIDGLMQGERANRTRIEQRQAAFQKKSTAWQEIQSKLTSLNAAAKVLGDGDAFGAAKATTSDDSLVGVSAGDDAQPASLTFTVDRLATAHQLHAGGFASTAATTGAGRAYLSGGLVGVGLTLADGVNLPAGRIDLEVLSVDGATASVRFGGLTQTVAASGNISLSDAQGNLAAMESTGLRVGRASIGIVETTATTTVAQLATAISDLGLGMSAIALDVDEDPGPSSLVMSASATGAANALTVDFSGLAGFAGHPVTELRAALDARLLLGDGTTEVTRSGNNISDVLPGVTLSLMFADPLSPVTVSVERDNESILADVKSMVEALNGAVNAVKRNVAYDVATKSAATLNGDTRAQIVMDRLRMAMQSTVAGSELSRASQLGISITASGTYALDEAKLRKAIEADREGVARLLAGDDLTPGSGVMSQVTSAINALTTGTGPVVSAINGARDSLASLDEDLVDEDRRLALVEERIRRKYTALESTLATLSSQANGLTAALAG